MDAVRKADFAFVSGNGSSIRHRSGAVQALKFQGMSWVDVRDRPALSDALKGLREPGVWIDPVHFCGLQERGDICPGPAAASRSCEQGVLSSDCLRSDGALDNVGIDFDPPIAQEAFESGPPGDGVADRLGEFGFPGQARQFRFPQVEEPCHNGG